MFNRQYELERWKNRFNDLKQQLLLCAAQNLQARFDLSLLKAELAQPALTINKWQYVDEEGYSLFDYAVLNGFDALVRWMISQGRVRINPKINVAALPEPMQTILTKAVVPVPAQLPLDPLTQQPLDLLTILYECKKPTTTDCYEKLFTVLKIAPELLHQYIYYLRCMQPLEFILMFCTPETLRIAYQGNLPEHAVYFAYSNLPMLHYLSELEPQVFQPKIVAQTLERIITKSCSNEIKLPIVRFLLKFSFSTDYQNLQGWTLLQLALWHCEPIFHLLVGMLGINHANAKQETLLHRLISEGASSEYQSDMPKRLDKLAIVLDYNPDLFLRNSKGLTAFEAAFRLERHLLAFRLARHAQRRGISVAELQCNVELGKVMRVGFRKELNEVIKKISLRFYEYGKSVYVALEALHTVHSTLAQTSLKLANETAVLKKQTVGFYNELVQSQNQFEKLQQLEVDAELFVALKSQLQVSIEKYASVNGLSKDLMTFSAELPMTRFSQYSEELSRLQQALLKIAMPIAHRYGDKAFVMKNLMSCKGAASLIDQITELEECELIPGMVRAMAVENLFQALDQEVDLELPASSMEQTAVSYTQSVQRAGGSPLFSSTSSNDFNYGMETMTSPNLHRL